MSAPNSFAPTLRIPTARPLTPAEHDANFGEIEDIFTNMTAGVAGADLTDVNRMFSLLLKPAAMIFPYTGSIASIPSGFALCNAAAYATTLGSGTLPDLRNSFIVGADADVAGIAKSTITGAALKNQTSTSHVHSGGTLAVPNHSAITESNLPLYTPVVSGDYNRLLRDISAGGLTTGSTDGGPAGEPDVTSSATISLNTYGTGSPAVLTHSSLTGSVGSSSHIPTFYALAYITYIGV
jgi:hypothetical protein